MAAVRTRRTVQEIEKIAIECIQRLGYENLLPEQKTAIINFVCGHDVFVCLPTGFGKSLIYFSLPLIYDTLYSRNKSSIIIVVSPLNALMDDQVRFLSGKGISSVALGGRENHSDHDTIREGITQGHYQIIFTSPERLLADKEWRDIFQCELLHECVVGLIIDEAHCVHKWYVYNVHAQ